MTASQKLLLAVADKVRIGIDAPQSVEIAREEVIEDEPVAAELGGEHV